MSQRVPKKKMRGQKSNPVQSQKSERQVSPMPTRSQLAPKVASAKLPKEELKEVKKSNKEEGGYVVAQNGKRIDKLNIL